MSFVPNTYVGYYIELITKEKIIKKPIVTCVNEDCYQHGAIIHTDFCPSCGSKIKEIDVKKEANQGWHLIGEEIGNVDLFNVVSACEADVGEGKELLLENQSDKFSTYLDPRDVENIDLANINHAKEQFNFGEYYKDVLSLLEKHNFEYEIKFGVINYLR